MRVGQGYDIHPLAPGRPLVLAGVTVPHDAGLQGDSDADVALHAVMDALLGAVGAGDLGSRFPKERVAPGVSSAFLTRAVMGEVRSRGLHVVNVDVTIIAEAPRLIGYRDAMLQSLAALLETEAVSVKFKTGDGLGVVGRQEGVAALAVVLLDGELDSVKRPPVP